VSEAGRSFRTELARVRGLGAAKEGVHHWWMQRVSAIALVPLALWFVIALVAHVGADYATTRAWLGSPVTFGLMVLLVGATFYHAQLGLQVVIEDYIHPEGWKIGLILLIKMASLVLALAAVVALLVIAFKEPATHVSVDEYSLQPIAQSGTGETREFAGAPLALDPAFREGANADIVLYQKRAP